MLICVYACINEVFLNYSLPNGKIDSVRDYAWQTERRRDKRTKMLGWVKNHIG